MNGSERRCVCAILERPAVGNYCESKRITPMVNGQVTISKGLRLLYDPSCKNEFAPSLIQWVAGGIPTFSFDITHLSAFLSSDFITMKSSMCDTNAKLSMKS
jgi:hypothetical protein